MAKNTETLTKRPHAAKIIKGSTGAVQVDVDVRNKREKLIASKRAAGLSPELAETTADRQIDLDNGKIRSAFADPALDHEEAVATDGVNTDAAQIPHNPNAAEQTLVEVHLNKTAKE